MKEDYGWALAVVETSNGHLSLSEVRKTAPNVYEVTLDAETMSGEAGSVSLFLLEDENE